MKNARPVSQPSALTCVNDTSTQAQRERLLAALKELGAVNTMFARDALNIMSPAARIKELRERGHKIDTDRLYIYDRDGRLHSRVARYVLMRQAQASN
ncbi:helix-turn-helix domain-containing protein [Marinobacter nauticus]|uniref:helix-turn-helix domain-containing protein n=1 Tax=Marinobacter nauticus TaxID=2743 RepID=UPI001C98A568|nr:helix-turn-helix domain-containing protein [Marinobacter nauticus]MBY6102961.1 helix-turn-helix domain-containing protein [Marinobacter nauticus]